MIFEVQGKPTGKARARTFYNANLGRTQSITPQGTVSYENLVKTCYTQKLEQIEGTGGWFDKQPLAMTVIAYFEIPKSASKKNREKMVMGLLLPTKKPDADNIAKIICDALNGVAYHDDTQIVQLNIIKRYTAAQPKVIVELDQIEFPTSSH